MSDSPPAPESHEGLIRTPRQLVWTIVGGFVLPVLIILLLANYMNSSQRLGAGSDGLTDAAIAERLRPVGQVEFREAGSAGAQHTGEQVVEAQCTVCHGTGVAGAPKIGDSAEWAPRIKAGYDALLESALKGKGAMAPQGGGEYSDLEIGRAVVFMANKAGAKFAEPAAPAAEAASAPQ